jgi:hypothetical protein
LRERHEKEREIRRVRREGLMGNLEGCCAAPETVGDEVPNLLEA